MSPGTPPVQNMGMMTSQTIRGLLIIGWFLFTFIGLLDEHHFDRFIVVELACLQPDFNSGSWVVGRLAKNPQIQETHSPNATCVRRFSYEWKT